VNDGGILPVMEEFKPIPHQEKEEKNEALTNPNSIGEVLSVGKDLPTSPDKVYRSVQGSGAIEDLLKVGVVRNAHAAGKTEHSRWGERVFWSRGAVGKFHVVASGTYVIETSYSVASERVVTKEDITALYVKNEDGSVKDIWSGFV
jgi:hypothetical protein